MLTNWRAGQVKRSISSLVLLTWLNAACAREESQHPSRESCEELRAHAARLAAASAGRGLNAAELARHEENLVAAAGENYVTECVEQRSKKYVACALETATMQALDACSSSK